MPIKIDVFLPGDDGWIDWDKIIKAEGTYWKNALSIEEMADAVTAQVDDARSISTSDLNDFYSEFDLEAHRPDGLDDLISGSESIRAVMNNRSVEETATEPAKILEGVGQRSQYFADPDATHEFENIFNIIKKRASDVKIDVSEIEFCKKASLNRIRELLRQRDEFGQAALLVLLEHFRPDFFAVDQQVITQGVVDLSRANELIEKMNDALMFCGDQYYHVDDQGERAIVKHYLLKIVKGSSGTVNLRGQYHGGWINIRGVVTDHKGEILKLMVEVNPFRVPHVIYRYYNP